LPRSSFRAVSAHTSQACQGEHSLTSQACGGNFSWSFGAEKPGLCQLPAACECPWRPF
jgi:hypothetical protein